MRRIRRAQERYAKVNRLFKRRVLAAGTAATLSLATGTILAQSTALAPGDKHQLSVPRDADRDLLANAEELSLGYRPFNADQNRSGLPDGAELAARCAGAIAQLPTEDAVTDPGQTYKKEMLVFGLETCAICGETTRWSSSAFATRHWDAGSPRSMPLVPRPTRAESRRSRNAPGPTGAKSS